MLAASVGSAPVLQAPALPAQVLSAPVLPAPVDLSVIYAVLSQIRICRNLRVFGANFLGSNLYLCFSNRFLRLCLLRVEVLLVRGGIAYSSSKDLIRYHRITITISISIMNSLQRQFPHQRIQDRAS